MAKLLQAIHISKSAGTKIGPFTATFTDATRQHSYYMGSSDNSLLASNIISDIRSLIFAAEFS